MRTSTALLFVTLALVAGCRPTRLAGTAIGQYEVRGTLTQNTCAEGYPAPLELWFHVELRDEPGTSVGYWKLSDGPLSGGAIDRAAGTFRFEDRQEVVGLAAEPAYGYPGCVLNRLEVVSGQLQEEVADGGPNDGGPDDAGPTDAGPSDAGPSDAGRTDAGRSDAGRSDAGASASPDAADLADAAANDPAPSGEARFVGTTRIDVSTASGSDCSPLLDPSQGGFPVLPCTILYEIRGDRLEENLW